MTIELSPVALPEILALRDLYRREMNCQIVHDSYHQRGFTDSYLIRIDGRRTATSTWKSRRRSGGADTAVISCRS
jgi:hypothetical protein